MHVICNLKFNVPNEIFVDFLNSSNYDYHFIIKQFANKFEGMFEYYGENIFSARSMANSLSNLVDNLAEGIHKIKCKRLRLLSWI